MSSDEFRIRKNDKVGYADAEEDTEFLAAGCFVDNGDLELLRDTHAPARIVLGRTGAGKTALLKMLERNERHAVWVTPEGLSLTYLSNNQILRFFEQEGVNLDLFYRLLWRHIFAVELIKARYALTNAESARQNFFQKLTSIFGKDERKEKAVEYLREWGESIWMDTEYRVREITEKLETSLRAKISGFLPIASAGVDRVSRLTSEQKAEVLKRGQDVVNSLQIKRLSEVIELLAENVFDDPQNHFYLLIDRLDEGWVEDRLRYRLIRALIETVRDFQKVRNCKIVIALRQDLLDRVFRLTRDAGFQEEKYDSLTLKIRWTNRSLIAMLDKRVNQLLCHRYTRKQVTHKDLLPERIHTEPVSEYILSRTLYRPRDLIQFFNYCLEQAEGQAKLNMERFSAAEAEYSRLRLRSLGDEWYGDYQDLVDYAKAFLEGMNQSFSLAEIADTEIEEKCIAMFMESEERSGALAGRAWAVANGESAPRDFLQYLFSVFYRVGLVGLKLSPQEGVMWAFLGQVASGVVHIEDTMRIYVCPAFYRVLGIRPEKV